MISPPASTGGSFAAQAPATAPAAAPKLRMNPSANFVYVYHPKRWDVVQVDGEYCLVPILNEFRFEAGVGGVAHVRNHAEGDATAALAFEQARGGQILDPRMKVQAFDREMDGYVRSYDGYRGRVHLSVWHRPFVLGDDHVVDHDTDGFNRWRRSLVTSGVVPAPDPTVITAMRVRFERTRSRYAAVDTIASLSLAEKYEARLTALSPSGPPRAPAAVPAAPPPAPTAPEGDRIGRLEKTVSELTDIIKHMAEHVRTLAPSVAPPALPTDPKPLTTEAGDKPAADSKPPKRGAKPPQD